MSLIKSNRQLVVHNFEQIDKHIGKMWCCRWFWTILRFIVSVLLAFIEHDPDYEVYVRDIVMPVWRITVD